MEVKVSIILPCYNHEKYIKACILSVLNQSYSNFELLVADDCSQDHSWDIINEINDPRMKKIRFESNIGTVQTLNYLLSKCDGDYIAVIGSDDYWQPDKLSKQLKYMELHNKCGACFSWAKIVDENNVPYHTDSRINEDLFRAQNRTQGEWLKFFFDTGNHLCHSSVLIRKSVHDSIGEYNVAYRQLHDFDLWIRLLNSYPIHIICEDLVGYRRTRTASGCVSEGSKENMIRLIHENNNIFYQLFCNIRTQVLIEGFCGPEDHMETNEDIIFRKYCILRKYCLCGVSNLSLANIFLMNHMNKKVIDLMSKSGISLNHFYKDTGDLYHVYPPSFETNSVDLRNKISELNNTVALMEKVIQEMTLSSSWKITAPLRFIASKLKMLKK